MVKTWGKEAMITKSVRESTLTLCMDIARSRGIVAVSLYGSWVCGYSDEKSDLNVLLVLSNYRPRLKGYLKPLDGINAFILVVDQGVFERDVEQGWLGEFVAEKITVPYEPLINEEYLKQQEVKVKKRIIWELLENIVLEFPELSHELFIKTEYFMYEAMMQRSRVFPPVTYTFLNMMRSDVKRKNTELMMDGYLSALNELAEEDLVVFSNGYVEITRSFIHAIRSRKLRISILLRSVQRTVFLHILGIFPKMMNHLVHEEEIFMRTHQKVEAERLVSQLDDPREYLLIPTSLGFASLSDKTTIEDFVRKAFPSGDVLGMEIEEIGGVLNAVYLLKFRKDNCEQRVVVKKFKNWLSVKWFPLALWTLGTKAFAVLGRSRLEREYAINQFLQSQGFLVPRILYVSPQECLIFEDFIEGENLIEIIKRVISSEQETEGEVALVKEVGRKIAEAHQLGVSLGDCKPENIIVTEDGKTCFVDLEQASRNGNQAWDIAEFLYYSGHYISPISSGIVATVIAKNFIEGYLEAGGRKETIKKAGSARYIKVFSVFTPPHVIIAISDLCQKMGKG